MTMFLKISPSKIIRSIPNAIGFSVKQDPALTTLTRNIGGHYARCVFFIENFYCLKPFSFIKWNIIFFQINHCGTVYHTFPTNITQCLTNLCLYNFQALFPQINTLSYPAWVLQCEINAISALCKWLSIVNYAFHIQWRGTILWSLYVKRVNSIKLIRNLYKYICAVLYMYVCVCDIENIFVLRKLVFALTK